MACNTRYVASSSTQIVLLMLFCATLLPGVCSEEIDVAPPPLPFHIAQPTGGNETLVSVSGNAVEAYRLIDGKLIPGGSYHYPHLVDCATFHEGAPWIFCIASTTRDLWLNFLVMHVTADAGGENSTIEVHSATALEVYKFEKWTADHNETYKVAVQHGSQAVFVVSKSGVMTIDVSNKENPTRKSFVYFDDSVQMTHVAQLQVSSHTLISLCDSQIFILDLLEGDLMWRGLASEHLVDVATFHCDVQGTTCAFMNANGTLKVADIWPVFEVKEVAHLGHSYPAFTQVHGTSCRIFLEDETIHIVKTSLAVGGYSVFSVLRNETDATQFLLKDSLEREGENSESYAIEFITRKSRDELLVGMKKEGDSMVRTDSLTRESDGTTFLFAFSFELNETYKNVLVEPHEECGPACDPGANSPAKREAYTLIIVCAFFMLVVVSVLLCYKIRPARTTPRAAPQINRFTTASLAPLPTLPVALPPVERADLPAEQAERLPFVMTGKVSDSQRW